MKPKMIDQFQGEYRFLSNFYPAIVDMRSCIDYEGKEWVKGMLGAQGMNLFSGATPVIPRLVFPTSEHAYQAMKTFDVDTVKLIRTAPTAAAAKRLGKKLILRVDWSEKVALHNMELVVWAKFTQNRDLAAKLWATGDNELVEGNTWKDEFWGKNAFTWEGHNHLGKILMKVRERLLDYI